MSLELCILASGSAGNATLLRSPAGVILIDAGIGPRICAKRLDGTSVRVADISALCLTHLDSDHFTPTWIPTLIRNQVPVFCHADRLADLASRADDDNRAAFESLLCPFDGSPFHPLAGVAFHPIPLAHDAAGSHGFVVEGFDHRIGYATDLGRVPTPLLDRFHDLDVLALEANYDPAMQEQSARPIFLKRRIMGGKGHLSNSQALSAIQFLLDRAQSTRTRLPDHIVLLHRSRQCNCPNLVRKLFTKDRRIATRLTLAEQYHRSAWLRRRTVRPATGEQLLLAF